MDAALVTAWCTGIGGIIGAITLLVRVIRYSPRLPVAEEVLLRVGELEEVVLLTASYVHTERTRAAAHGYTMAEPPDRLLAILGDSRAPQGRRLTPSPLVAVPPRRPVSADG